MKITKHILAANSTIIKILRDVALRVNSTIY